MNLTIADHLLGLLLAVLPLAGVWQFRRLKARLAAGERDVRLSHYRAILAEEILLTGAVLALWLFLGRPWDQLAPTPPISGAWLGWVGWAVTAVACVLLVVQTVALARSGEGRAAARRQLESMAEFLPHTERELRSFRVLSVAAGVSEEIVFRGFALAWLASLASSGFGLGPAAALAAAVAGGLVRAGPRLPGSGRDRARSWGSSSPAWRWRRVASRRRCCSTPWWTSPADRRPSWPWGGPASPTRSPLRPEGGTPRVWSPSGGGCISGTLRTPRHPDSERPCMKPKRILRLVDAEARPGGAWFSPRTPARSCRCPRLRARGGHATDPSSAARPARTRAWSGTVVRAATRCPGSRLASR